MEKQPNPENIGVNVGLSLLGAGLLLMVGPSVAGADMMRWGYGVRFMGLFVVISGLVTWWFFHARSAVLGRILSGQGVLAHWTYDSAEAQKHARDEFEERSSANRQLFLLVAGMMLVAGFAFFIVLPMVQGDDVILPGLLFFLMIIALIGWVARAAPRTAYRRAQAWGTEVYVSADGLWVRGALHTWREPFTQLKKVRLVERGGEKALEFQLSYLTRVGWIHYETTTVVVPVPAGKEEEAGNVVKLLGRK